MYIHDTQHTSSAKSKEGIITYLDISLNFAFVTSFAFDNFSTFAIDVVCVLGWSEKHKSWKMQKYRADSEPRHSTDFRTIF